MLYQYRVLSALTKEIKAALTGAEIYTIMLMKKMSFWAKNYML